MPSKPRPNATKPAPPPATRAALYLRVSTEEQAEDGYGLGAQRHRCGAMATVKGWHLVGEYADEGVSGTKGAEHRPALARLLADAQTGQLDAVIVLGLDRLGRKTRLVLELVEQLATAGVVLVSCKESLDTSTPQGQFVLTMFAALAQLDRDLIVERTTGGRNERGRIDGEKGGSLPYGYVRHEDAIGIDPAAVPVVKTIFKLRQKQRLSLRAICAQLATPPPRGVRWHPSSIAAILDNEAAYRGGLRGDSPVHWPRIL